jgi:hypothetical protein
MYFYEQITTKTLHMRMNDINISHRLGQLLYKYYVNLSLWTTWWDNWTSLISICLFWNKIMSLNFNMELLK